MFLNSRLVLFVKIIPGFFAGLSSLPTNPVYVMDWFACIVLFFLTLSSVNELSRSPNL